MEWDQPQNPAVCPQMQGGIALLAPMGGTHRIPAGDTVRFSTAPIVPQWHPWVSNGTHRSLPTPTGPWLMTLTAPQWHP